jgi:ACT domain
MSHLLRVSLPDVPGSLGAVASALGAVKVDIDAVEIVEHRADGTAVDDFLVELAPGVMPDVVVSAVQRLDGVRVLWVSRYAAAGNLHLDLEAVEVISQDPSRAVELLAEVIPATFRSDWSMIAERDGDDVLVLHRSRGAPELMDEARSWFPVVRAVKPDVAEESGGWANTIVAVVPLGSAERAVIFGRHGGPEILDSELARLNHLAALVSTIEAAADPTG